MKVAHSARSQGDVREFVHVREYPPFRALFRIQGHNWKREQGDGKSPGFGNRKILRLEDETSGPFRGTFPRVQCDILIRPIELHIEGHPEECAKRSGNKNWIIRHRRREVERGRLLSNELSELKSCLSSLICATGLQGEPRRLERASPSVQRPEVPERCKARGGSGRWKTASGRL